MLFWANTPRVVVIPSTCGYCLSAPSSKVKNPTDDGTDRSCRNVSTNSHYTLVLLGSLPSTTVLHTSSLFLAASEDFFPLYGVLQQFLYVCVCGGGGAIAPGVSRRQLTADPRVPFTRHTHTHIHKHTHACFHLRNTDHRHHFFGSRSMHRRACCHAFWLFCPVRC